MKNILIFIQLVLSLSLFAAVETRHTTTNSGLFSSASTWTLGTVPAWGDSWTIMPGHTLEYDLTNELSAGAYGTAFPTNAWGNCTNNGTFSITNNPLIPNMLYCKFTNNLSGTGQWLIGRSDAPITSLPDRIDRVLFDWGDRGSCTMIGTNTVKFYSDTNFFYDTTTNNVAINGTNLFFTNNVVGVTSNDVIYVSNPAIVGQGGSTHLVYSVNTNCITVYGNFTGLSNKHTNNWPGETFSTNIQVNIRTNAAVSKLSRPVVFLQRAKIANTGIFGAANINSNVTQGARFTFTGSSFVYGAARDWKFYSCVGNNNINSGIANGGTGHTITSCIGNNNINSGITYLGTGHTITSCIGNNNINGGITYSGTGHTITSCIGNNISNGGIAYAGSGHTITSCVGNNSNGGGITYSGTGHTITSCIGNNINGGGIANGGTGHTITSCIGNNITGGGITYSGTGHTITSCIGNNSNSGGIANGGTGHTITSCIGNNSSNGGIANACLNCIVTDCVLSVTNVNNGQHIYRSAGIIAIAKTNSYLVNAQLIGTVNNLSPVNVNYTNFVTPSGMASIGTDKTITFYPSNALAYPAGSAAKAVAYIPVAIKSILKPTVSLFLTNGLSYQIVTDRNLIPTVLSTTPVYTNTTGWTNISLSLTNGYPMAIDSQYLYVICTMQNAGTNGMAKITVPTEYTTVTLP